MYILSRREEFKSSGNFRCGSPNAYNIHIESLSMDPNKKRFHLLHIPRNTNETNKLFSVPVSETHTRLLYTAFPPRNIYTL